MPLTILRKPPSCFQLQAPAHSAHPCLELGSCHPSCLASHTLSGTSVPSSPQSCFCKSPGTSHFLDLLPSVSATVHAGGCNVLPARATPLGSLLVPNHSLFLSLCPYMSPKVFLSLSSTVHTILSTPNHLNDHLYINASLGFVCNSRCAFTLPLDASQASQIQAHSPPARPSSRLHVGRTRPLVLRP